MSKYENEVKNGLFGFGEENTAFAKYFINKSYLNGLIPADDNIDVMWLMLILNRDAAITGIFTIKATNYCW
ncbi:hypothetical protein SAMN05216431_10191 [Ligilactobacillus sp. WC1T17]|uniref:Uncharacterized protein n=1 Tax=Ligilactobacillus ruminis TaxID=1623 RepID=A0ABY1A8Z8_9LACO|nr:hypothetical protein SAMN05216431_10191 [Ligilactobacillus ruminis]